MPSAEEVTWHLQRRSRGICRGGHVSSAEEVMWHLQRMSRAVCRGGHVPSAEEVMWHLQRRSCVVCRGGHVAFGCGQFTCALARINVESIREAFVCPISG